VRQILPDTIKELANAPATELSADHYLQISSGCNKGETQHANNPCFLRPTGNGPNVDNQQGV
jgi:hypothetical protein